MGIGKHVRRNRIGGAGGAKNGVSGHRISFAKQAAATGSLAGGGIKVNAVAGVDILSAA
jgi:hypothetical protein